MKKVKHLAVFTFFLCALSSHATSNIVTGLAYGTDYADLATASSIASVTNGNGSLNIGHESTTNLTLIHDITGFILIDNQVPGLKIEATGATVENSADFVFAAANATNLTITGGHFIGTTGSGGNLPPIPGRPDPTNTTSAAMGGLLLNSSATINNAEFAGIEATEGLVMDRSTLTTSNSIFRGGETGAGLVAGNNSMVTIHSGQFAGGAGDTAFYLRDSDATVYGGTFVGNGDGSSGVAGDGLFSILTQATTNQVSLFGGDFSSLAFYGETGSIQHFLAGTNLVVHNGIIQDGGTVMVDNQSDSALQDLTIFSGIMDFTTHTYSLFDGGTLDFGITEGTNGLLTAEAATFHTNTTISADATAAGFSSGTNDLNVLETTTGIFVATDGGITNATTANFNSNVNVTVATDWLTTFTGAFIDGGKNLRLQFIAQSWGDAWGAEGQFGDFADELQLLDDGAMAIIIASMTAESSKTATAETYFTSMNTFQTTMQGLQAAVGQSVSRGAEFREQLKLLPPGAKGPERENNLRGWAKYYGQFYNHDANELNPEYETTLHGGVIGVDQSFGNLLIGVGGGAGNYATTAGTDSEETIKAYQGSLYGTYGTERAFFDSGIAYGFNQVETQTGGPFILEGEFDAQIISAYFGGGYDLIDTKGGTVFTPEASIQYSMYEQDAYSETSTTAVPRNIDAFDADSLRSSLGLNVSMLNTKALETFGFKLDGRVHWLHEFNPEPGSMTFSLEGGNNDYQLAYPLLDEELFRAGFGFSFFNTMKNKPKNVLLRLDFDELFGDGFNSHNLSAKVIYAF